MNAPEINDYRFGQIVIDGEAYAQDLIILPAGVLPGWRRQQGHRLLPDDLGPVLAGVPAVLIVGCGAFSRVRIPPETRQVVQAAGIELLAQPTKLACQTYNTLRNNHRVVAAALHLTC